MKLTMTRANLEKIASNDLENNWWDVVDVWNITHDYEPHTHDKLVKFIIDDWAEELKKKGITLVIIG